jgi:hypothetical protein
MESCCGTRNMFHLEVSLNNGFVEIFDFGFFFFFVRRNSISCNLYRYTADVLNIIFCVLCFDCQFFFSSFWALIVACWFFFFVFSNILSSMNSRTYRKNVCMGYNK